MRRKLPWLTGLLSLLCSFVFASVAPAQSDLPPRDDPTTTERRASKVDSRRLEDAVARAEAAAEEAAIAARAADRARREADQRRERSGPYFGGAFFYAAEHFDDSIIVKSSTGGAAFIGYRLAPIFAAEVRYEHFEAFDLEGRSGRAEIDGYAITASLKALPFQGPVQPFVTVGVGGIRLEQKTVFNSGRRSRASDSDAAFRVGAGIDFWLNESLVLNAEAAYLTPADDLSNLDMTILSTGLTYRF